ncbi:MAG: tRNA1(Val) (adenine(37)-N6)-methyltransferase [Wolinella sp.]
MQIYQNINGYAYNSDSLFLYDFARPFLKKNHRLLDIGAGCGILGLLCARDSGCEVVLVERESDAFRFLSENIRVNMVKAHAIKSDFLELDEGVGKFDVAISNPPFYHKNVIKSQNPSLYAARYEENLPFSKLLYRLKRFLKPRGIFIFCFDSKQSARVFSELKSSGFQVENVRFVHPRKDRESTLVMVQTRRESKAILRVLPPLFVFNDEEYSDETKEVFKRARTHSIKCQL